MMGLWARWQTDEAAGTDIQRQRSQAYLPAPRKDVGPLFLDVVVMQMGTHESGCDRPLPHTHPGESRRIPDRAYLRANALGCESPGPILRR